MRVYATNTHAAVAPVSVRPGIVHIRNIGRDPMLVLQPKRASSTAHVAVADVRSTSPAPLLHDFHFVGEAVPTLDNYVRVTRGSLLFVDIATPHLRAGKVGTTQVQGSREDARVPSSRRLVITRHKRLHVPYVLPRRTWLHVLNHSSAISSFLFVGVAKKTTYKALHNLVEHPSLLKIFKLLSFNLVPLSDAGPHSASWQQFHARPGRYVAAALVFSTNDAHLHHGQVRVLHVR